MTDPTRKLSADDFAPEVPQLFDRYVHGALDRRRSVLQAHQHQRTMLQLHRVVMVAAAVKNITGTQQQLELPLRVGGVAGQPGDFKGVLPRTAARAAHGGWRLTVGLGKFSDVGGHFGQRAVQVGSGVGRAHHLGPVQCLGQVALGR